MNLLCPNCQKMLTVPEQYAGQLMKCPLCAGTFTVPGLPSAPTAAAPPPAPPPGPSTYPIQPEAPAPSAPPLTSQASTAPAPSSSGTPPPPPPPGGPMTFSLWFKPEIVQWIAAAAVVLILIFTLFFPWVGVYPGGVPAVWQNPLQIVIGGSWGYSEDPNMKNVFHFPTSQELADNKELYAKLPGFGFLMLMYIPLLLLTVALTVACAVLPVLKLKLPPAVAPVLQWRWGIAAALNLLVFLLLMVIILVGFPIESSVYNWKMASDEEAVKLSKIEKKSTEEQLQLKVKQGEAAGQTATTFWLKLVVLLHIIAIGAAGLMLALDRRDNRPPVHLDLVL
jgi:hypothetical protein